MLDFNPLLKQESETHFSVRYDARGHRRFYRKTQEGCWVLVPKDVFCMLRASVRQEENACLSEASHGVIPLTGLESGTATVLLFREDTMIYLGPCPTPLPPATKKETNSEPLELNKHLEWRPVTKGS